MKTKHTKEYAKELSNGMIPKDNKEAFIEGYMSAINQSAAPELLEALVKLYNAIDSCIDLTPELLIECNNAIKKATE